jgi:outer membrane protein assembly factor BamB/tetratricopeptide (TPR) repeat protein
LVAAGAIALCAARPIRAEAAAPAAGPFLQAIDMPAGAAADDEGAEEPSRQAAEGRSVFTPPDRATLRLLGKARQLIDQGRYAEAVRCLGAILENSQDYFFHPESPEEACRSLKSEARRLLGVMSHRGRQLYELQYGARASQMLSEAVAAGDANGLAEVSRRYFHTQAGYEATFVLGLHHLDHGRPLAAALAFARLREAPGEADRFEPALSLASAVCWIRAGKPDRAKRSLSALRERLLEALPQGREGSKEREPGGLVAVAGEEVPLFTPDRDVLEWLTDLVGPPATPELEQPSRWAMFRGDRARNASTAGDGPLLSRRWRVRTSTHPYLEALIEQIRDGDHDWDRWAPPALQPIVVDGVVLMRTAYNLLAVDFATGKRLWQAPLDDPFQTLLDPPLNVSRRRVPQMEYALRLRMWADATYGSISSDGRRVFAIEDLGLEIGPRRLRAAFIAGRRSTDSAGPKPYNRLAAYDIRAEGKLKWHIGGSPDEYGLPEAGTFFLGPPLPLQGRLYVIAERMGEICLIALDAESGDVLWSQQLAGADRLLLKNPLRRIAGVSPSYADGVLVCPTSNRSIVAVEVATRALLWGYTYPQSDARSRRPGGFFGAQSVVDPDPADRWIDSSVILAEGRVLATPVDSDCLHCLDLFDGELLWKEPRQDDLYVACVYQGKVVLVGERGVRALDLYDGMPSGPAETRDKPPGREPSPAGHTSRGDAEQRPDAKLSEMIDDLVRSGRPDDFQRPAPAWNGRTVEFPIGSRPTGFGFLSVSRGAPEGRSAAASLGEGPRRALYHVPLSTAEVMAIDVETGEAADVFRSRQGSVPGNLVVCRGRVLSQDATGLEAFDQLGALRKEVNQRLATASDDAEALSLRGEILWAEGKLEEAMESLRRSFELQPAPGTRELLREAVFDGLRKDFSKYRDLVSADGVPATSDQDGRDRLAARGGNRLRLEQLIDEPAQQATYIRLMAVGLAGAGEFRPALEHYLKLIELDRDHRDMEPVDPSLAVRRDRWIQAQLAALRDSVPDDVRAEIDRVAVARLERALGQEGPEPIRRFLQYFGRHPVAAEARRHLVRRLRASGDLLAAELLLKRQARSPDAPLRGAALAELAEILRGSGRRHDAALCYQRLERELAGVACVDGKTGREVVESLPADDPIRNELAPGWPWPTGRVLVAKSTPEAAPQPTYNQTPLVFEGDRSPFFSDMTVELHQAPLPMLVGRDGLGQQVWRLPLAEFSRQDDFLLNRSLMRVSVCGHLLVLSSGQRILAADTSGIGLRRPLWSRDLDQPSSDPSTRAGLQVQLANLAAGLPQIRASRYANGPMSLPRIVNEQLLCFKQLRSCLALDPCTGETLWIRRNVPGESELFGDDEFVFLVRPGETTATVLRALDGEVLAQREVPQHREKTVGRHLLVWRHADERRVLEMVDPWQNRPLWPPKEFAPDARLRSVEEEAVAVYEPAGRFVLIDLMDGRTVIDAELEPETSPAEILVLPSPNQYIVLLYDRGGSADPARRTFHMHGVTSEQIRRGQVYAFDREGNRLWPSPVTVEDQWLPLSQPRRLPVLTFACTVQERRPNARAQSKISVLCIDKRNGREIFRDQFDGATNSFDLVGDADKNTVELRLQRTTVTMTFTNEPLEPESPSGDAPNDRPSDAQEGKPGTVRSILKAIRSAFSGTGSGANER